MRFVQYKQDVIWKEGRMCLRGKPFEVNDSYALGVFSTDPQFEKVEEEHHEEERQGPDTAQVLKEAGDIPFRPKGKECPHCHKLIPKGWYFHQKFCKG